MKLRNKKTGEIHEITEVVPLHDMDKKFVIYSKTEGHNHAYKNLAEFNKEWEDYEEPTEHWFVDIRYPKVEPKKDINLPNSMRKRLKEIGNYFETKEEAERAVERLRAWKRLKDKGFRFEGWTIDDGLRISICTNTDSDGIYDEDRKEAKKDLDICFGGEE